uniref:peptidylprolyl isomerase n=1 Tax=Pseudictyota dubia TaxID=2749911 RepID=A0A7R9VSF3_9STRA|mmetsp:Transcript_21199/g.39633  ORF Transcript_21199/g.39633 Transcript_21199/m.39633 type:complete len:187 (+) Transcript_21199:92-652(+)
MRSFLSLLLLPLASTSALSVPKTTSPSSSAPSRRAFLTTAASSAFGIAAAAAPALAAPEIITTPAGVKYAITKPAPSGSTRPLKGDIVAIEYTGYLTSGQIFDATHSEGKKNALLFKLGSESAGAIPGLNDVVSQMQVGEKVQAIIPPSLAYGDKGVCLENGECLIKPGSTLVYDVLLKKSSIPPP